MCARQRHHYLLSTSKRIVVVAQIFERSYAFRVTAHTAEADTGMWNTNSSTCLTIAATKHLTYLGSTVSEDFDEKYEVRRRVAARNRIYSILDKILKNILVSQSTKFMLYKP